MVTRLGLTLILGAFASLPGAMHLAKCKIPKNFVMLAPASLPIKVLSSVPVRRRKKDGES